MKKQKQRVRICSRCGKREFTKSKSEFCLNCYIYERAKRVRKERVKNKCCAKCGKKVKPKIIIPYRCDPCQEGIKKSKLNKLGGEKCFGKERKLKSIINI